MREEYVCNQVRLETIEESINKLGENSNLTKLANDNKFREIGEEMQTKVTQPTPSSEDGEVEDFVNWSTVKNYVDKIQESMVKTIKKVQVAAKKTTSDLLTHFSNIDSRFKLVLETSDDLQK